MAITRGTFADSVTPTLCSSWTRTRIVSTFTSSSSCKYPQPLLPHTAAATTEQADWSPSCLSLTALHSLAERLSVLLTLRRCKQACFCINHENKVILNASLAALALYKYCCSKHRVGRRPSEQEVTSLFLCRGLQPCGGSWRRRRRGLDAPPHP